MPVVRWVRSDRATGRASGYARARAHRKLDVLTAVAVGGALGSVARYEIGRRFPVRAGEFPTSTLAINCAGSLILGFVLVVLVKRLPSSLYARAFLAVGVLGAFTTYSTFAVQACRLVADHHLATAVTFVVASVAGGLAAAWLGLVSGRSLPHPRPPTPRPRGIDGFGASNHPYVGRPGDQ